MPRCRPRSTSAAAPRRLRATQNELVQAGKLAALGQMSAAIAHEINQPLAAIRTFMASTQIFAQRGDGTQVVGQPRPDRRPRRAHGEHHRASEDVRAQERAGPARAGAGRRAVEGALFLIESQIKAGGRAHREGQWSPICGSRAMRCSSSR